MKKILVAEDTDSNYLLLSIILRKNYEVLRALNGKEAVEMHRDVKPDLILMEIKMPEMDGLEATRLIRKSDQDIPIVALTANAYDSDREKSIEAGCNSYMAKPVNATKLRELLASFLDD
jgi:CheY-like chemotaxis protein